MATIEVPYNFVGNQTGYTHVQHPYYPLGARIPHYEPNEWSVPALLSVFFGAASVLFSTTYFVSKAIQPKLSQKELLTTMWFALSGTIHVVFEGYYVTNFVDLAGKQTLMGQMWKEYAHGDSRYLTSNSQVLCLESITAVFWGPLCYIVAAMVVFRHPMRFPLQCVLSVGQFYGDFLYFATSTFDEIMLGIQYSRPEAYYFWFYYFFMNFIWLVVPGVLIYQSCTRCASALAIVDRMAPSKKIQ